MSHTKITQTSLDASPLIPSKYIFSNIFVISGAFVFSIFIGSTIAFELGMALYLVLLSDHCIYFFAYHSISFFSQSYILSSINIATKLVKSTLLSCAYTLLKSKKENDCKNVDRVYITITAKTEYLLINLFLIFVLFFSCKYFILSL